MIDGNSKINKNSETEVLIGGPAIRSIFDEKFSKEMQSIEPEVSKEIVIKSMKLTGGPRSSVFVPDTLFEEIVMDQINRLRVPSLQCSANIQRELEKVIKTCAKYQIETERFPMLMGKIESIMMQLLHKQMLENDNWINRIIDTELSCINTNHPDFSVQEVLKEYKNKNQPNNTNADA